jgi:hypothetical protein
MKGTMMVPALYCLDIMLLTLGALAGASCNLLALAFHIAQLTSDLLRLPPTWWWACCSLSSSCIMRS